jgi:hypothetical protein
MGSKVSVPAPSEEEKALQRNQAELLGLQRTIIEQQQQQNKVLLPFLAQQEGFDVQVDDSGNIVSISQSAEETARRTQSNEITSLLNQRSLDALHGNLPVDPALEEDLRVQEQELRNRLTGQLGPGYETSTPGIETLGNFFRQAEVLRSGARTGQLTLAEQLGITREQQQAFERQSSEDILRTSAVGDPLTFAGAFGQTARGYGQAQQPYIQNRQMQLQASVANASSSMGFLGAAIGGIGALFSDPDGKADLERVSSTPDGIPIYVYTHRGTGERMIGVLSTDVEKVRPWAVGRRLGKDTVRYHEVG